MALTHDPLRAVYEALDQAGCDPRGPEHKFTARCPGHDDRTPSLSVSVGADGRALLWCFAGCETNDVLRALGLQWADLFPAGHRHARRPRGIARPIRVLDIVLRALGELGIPWRCTRDPGMWVADLCPLCLCSIRWPLFVSEDDRGRVALSCAGGCDQVDVLRALVGAES